MLKQRAKTAAIWSGADILLRQGIQLGISIALARLLSPEEFGTIALLYLFVGLAGVFVDCGFSSALIQRQDITHTDESTVFWFNLIMGLFLALTLWFIAPLLASFYKLPILIPLTWVFALNLFFSALGSIHSTLLAKRLDFRTPMKIGAITTIFSGGIGIGMAWQGYGVWALAMQTLISTILTTVLLWTFEKWRPSLQFSLVSARRLFAFGGYLLMAGLLDVAYNRLYTLLIGKFYGVSELGFYNRADGTKQLPVGVLSSTFSRVALPIFSSTAGDKERLRRGVRIALRSMMLINVPMMFGLMATAEPVIQTLFGENWLPAVSLLQVLCLAGIFWPLHIVNLNVLMSQGYTNQFLQLEIVKKVVGTMLLLGGATFGVMGIAWSQVFFGLLAFGINAYYTRIHLNYSVWQQTKDFLPAMVVSIVMALMIYELGNLFDLDVRLKLLAQVLAGITIFITGCQFFRLQAYQDALDIISSRINKTTIVRAST